ncbi:hypothetical protein MYAM1_001792 [Malassezia yamatoensis]|uniref:Major facilitator superfamily (MFS) profile domain-containing protein n=1 Tax=Malassezia yamatoensis TaxID=253288 RepID=A0AAJ6CIN2_9BASI|nr:hypothetical protein MYAM1_001792 [Malassezia yamatoensis]
MASNTQFADQYIHHNEEPLGLHGAQAANSQAMPNQDPYASQPSSGNMTDSTRYNPSQGNGSGFPSAGESGAPLGNGMGDQGMTPEAERAFHEVLYPSDIYTPDGTYWADLPFGEKMRFCNRQSNAEARRELSSIGAMMKRDPLSPVKAYFGTYVLNGLGMFVEGYTLFSVGNIKPLFQATWPNCWKAHKECDSNWIAAIDYLEIIGIIVGQIVVGIEGDWVGRRFGMVQDAVIMTIGSVMLTAMWGINHNGWVICYAWSLFIYGIGVGGEYPMTSTRAMEGSGDRYATSTGDRMHRGRNVLLAFLMQGWGQFFNQVVLILLLLVFHNSLRPPYSKTAVQWTFRCSFGFIALITLFLVYYRYYKISYTEQSLRDAKTRLNTSGYDAKSLKLAISHYWGRLFASCFGWFANDFFFYGNKIFSGVFIDLITGGGGKLQTTWLYNLINIGVQLPGYYLAALLVDNKMYGRKNMQAVGFLCTFALFCGAEFAFKTLTAKNHPGNLKAFQFIFFFSSFWNQFGYNSTTFLVAAEMFPASIRASCHGFGAAWGKLGALCPTIIYNYVTDNHTKFHIVTWFGLAGLLVTLIFLPDTTGLDLREQERYWEYVMNGREEDYHGVAVHPRHLSLYERVVLKRNRYYNPQLDFQQKSQEFRQIYYSSLQGYENNPKDLTAQQQEFLNSDFGTKYVKDVSKGHDNSDKIHASKLESVERNL